MHTDARLKPPAAAKIWKLQRHESISSRKKFASTQSLSKAVFRIYTKALHYGGNRDSTTDAMGDGLQTRLEKLNAKEAEILILLARGFDIKASANELGITPNTVTERLRSARQKLGVSSSRQAARIYAKHTSPDHIFYVPMGNVVEPQPSSEPASDLPDHRVEEEGFQAAALLEQNATPFAHKPISLVDLSYLPLRRAGETRNELSPRQRLTAILDLTTKLAGGVALTCLLALIVDRLVASL